MSTLFISGAAFRLFLNLGALKHILTVKDFQNYVGTSSGSYIALGLVLGYTPDALMDLFVKIYPKVESDLNYSYLRLLYSGSLVSDSGKINFAAQMILNSPLYQREFQERNPLSITFRDLSRVTDLNFVCNAIDYETDEMEIFSIWTTSDLPIHTATTASMSIPGLFAPTLLPNGHRHIDGGFFLDFLPSAFDPNSNSYYKIRYPEVNIPIDLDLSWGCLVALKKTPSSAHPPAWSFREFLKFIPKLGVYLFDNQIRMNSYFIVNSRTWTIQTASSGDKLPKIREALELYQDGYRQASEQTISL